LYFRAATFRSVTCHALALGALCLGVAVAHAANSLLDAAETGDSAAAAALVSGNADVNAHQDMAPPHCIGLPITMTCR
jgi:hypothetical protein